MFSISVRGTRIPTSPARSASAKADLVALLQSVSAKCPSVRDAFDFDGGILVGKIDGRRGETEYMAHLYLCLGLQDLGFTRVLGVDLNMPDPEQNELLREDTVYVKGTAAVAITVEASDSGRHRYIIAVLAHLDPGYVGLLNLKD